MTNLQASNNKLTNENDKLKTDLGELSKKNLELEAKLKALELENEPNSISDKITFFEGIVVDGGMDHGKAPIYVDIDGSHNSRNYLYLEYGDLPGGEETSVWPVTIDAPEKNSFDDIFFGGGEIKGLKIRGFYAKGIMGGANGSAHEVNRPVYIEVCK